MGREFLERVELPIHGSTSSLFASDRHFQHSRGLCQQAHWHAKFAEALERLVELDVPAIDLKASHLERLSNIHAGDRAKQFAFLASFTHKTTRHRLQLLRQRLGVLPYPQNAVFPQAFFVLELALIFGRLCHSEAAWDEKIASIPIRHIHNVTNRTHMVHITHQNYFHRL